MSDVLFDESIELQQHGAIAMSRPEIAEKVGITKEQRQALGRIISELQSQFKSLQAKARKSKNPQELSKKAEKLKDDAATQSISTAENATVCTPNLRQPTRSANNHQPFKM